MYLHSHVIFQNTRETHTRSKPQMCKQNRPCLVRFGISTPSKHTKIDPIGLGQWGDQVENTPALAPWNMREKFWRGSFVASGWRTLHPSCWVGTNMRMTSHKFSLAHSLHASLLSLLLSLLMSFLPLWISMVHLINSGADPFSSWLPFNVPAFEFCRHNEGLPPIGKRK